MSSTFEEEFYEETKRKLEFDPEASGLETAVREEVAVTYAADMETTLEIQTALTASDRCDRCGAQAYLRVTLLSGGELLFCAHHAREHGDKLREIAAEIHDETASLSS